MRVGSWPIKGIQSSILMKMPMAAANSRIVTIHTEILNIGRVCTVTGVGMILDFGFWIGD